MGISRDYPAGTHPRCNCCGKGGKEAQGYRLQQDSAQKSQSRTFPAMLANIQNWSKFDQSWHPSKIRRAQSGHILGTREKPPSFGHYGQQSECWPFSGTYATVGYVR